MLRCDWLSYYQAIWPYIVAQSARHICNVLVAKKDQSLAVTSEDVLSKYFFD